jgi:predicted PurR-regulated permease PerM
MPPSEPRVLRIEIAPRTILAVMAALAGVWLLIELKAVVVLVVCALVLVGTLNPLLGWFERRRIHRNLGLALALLAMVAVVTVLLLVSLPALTHQVVDIVEDAPTHRENLVAWLQKSSLTRPLIHSVESFDPETMLDGAGDQLIEYSSRAIVGVGYAVTALVLAVYLLADGQRALGAAYALVPRSHHVKLARIIVELEIIVGGYVRGQLITSIAITVFTFGLLTLCGVDNALALAVFAGLTDVIPFVGGVLATAPAVIASIPHGLTVTLVVLCSMLVYQEFESRVLVPRVYGRVLRLSPAVVVLALLIGGTLMGILGALLALPVAAALQMAIRELRLTMPGEAPQDAENQALDANAEHRYEVLTEGMPAHDASSIATEIALEQRAQVMEAAAAVAVEAAAQAEADVDAAKAETPR